MSDVRERVLEILMSDELEPIVEMALVAEEPDAYRAVAHDGSVRFHRIIDGHRWQFVVDAVDGRNPLGDQAIDRFAGLDAELANRQPTRATNSYPFGYEQAAQLFDHRSAPDVCVIHAAAHWWEHIGEHGSIDAVQARAPFVVSGAGVRRDGLVDDACRLVDVAPTVLSLMAIEPTGGKGPSGAHRSDALLAHQSGEVVERVIDRDAEPPAHVIGLLFDGTNPNVMYEMAGRGDLPNVARLMDLGTAFRFGAMSSLPTVTLANHTSILTGCYPGHHGVLHNAWFDRESGERAVTNSPAMWPTSMQWLNDGVETIHHAVQRGRPGSVTVAINEPCDVGATYSTFDVMRSGGEIDRPPPMEKMPHTSHDFARPVKDYGWSSKIDHTGLQQFRGIWSGEEYQGRIWPTPAFSWCNFTLTDTAFHEGGPHSEIAEASLVDTDGRLGDIISAVEAAGAMDETAFVLVADHGMEEADESVTGDWGDHLRSAGIDFRDEGFGFLYLT